MGPPVGPGGGGPGMRSIRLLFGWGASLLLAVCGRAGTPGAGSDGRWAASFASVSEGVTILTRRDEFIAALSPFDRAARMRSGTAISEAAFLRFVGTNVVEWSAVETNKLGAVLRRVGADLAPWHLPLPAVVPLIKTTGHEEGNASYTRQQAVVLPQHEVDSPARSLERVMLHELFHVLSRQNPALRKRLYRIIGFVPINAITYPALLRPRQITNPDGVQSGWAITIRRQHQSLPVVPILYASTEHYDPHRGGEFFDYLVFKLLAVTARDGQWEPLLAEGEPRLIEPAAAGGFFEQIGRNTGYIIHPDEILAVNFVYLVEGQTNLPTPRIVAAMGKVLRER